jgi:tRNA(Ile)-lysidine synthetase-like protein
MQVVDTKETKKTKNLVLRPPPAQQKIWLSRRGGTSIIDVSELASQVERTIERRGLFQDGQPILVAVSGGLDSMVLLRVLHELAAGHGWRLRVAHLNHRLRGRSSDADARLVRRVAAALGLPCVIGRSEVREFARARGLSLEMAARKVRHDFLARKAARLALPTVALAHHADDQLELFFLRLLRGCGGEGLAGMKWRSPSPSDPKVALVRPLLDQPKAALRRWAASRKVPFREDASNAELDIRRNRIRHELLPLLRRQYQPALHRTILRLMDIVGQEAAFAAQEAQEWLAHWSEAGARQRAEDHRQGVWVTDLPRRSPPQPSKPERGNAAHSKHSAKQGHTAEIAKRLECPDASGPLWPRPRLHIPLADKPFVELPVAVQRRCIELQLLAWGLEPDYELVEQLRTRPNRPVTVGRASMAGAGPKEPGEWKTSSQPSSRPLSDGPFFDRVGDEGCDKDLESQFLGQAPADSQTEDPGQRLAPADAPLRGPGVMSVSRDAEGWVRRSRAEPVGFRPGTLQQSLCGRAGEVLVEGLRLRWRIARGGRKPRPGQAGREFFDADRVGTPVVLRHWQPGDRFQPIGLPVPVKLQDLFTNQKILRQQRHELIVAATAQGEVFWVEGLRISERFKLRQATKRRLQWSWQRP